MLSIYRFMNRQNGHGELEKIVRFQKIDFPADAPATATAEQKEELAKAVADAARQEARFGQVVLADWSATGGIVAVEDLKKRGHSDCLVWVNS
jgi:hypothetical protein